MDKKIRDFVLRKMGKIAQIGIILTVCSAVAVGQDRMAQVEKTSTEYRGVPIIQDITKSTALNKIISVNLQEVPLLEALGKIAIKANLELVYNSKLLAEKDRSITINLEQVTIEKAMWAVLEETDLRFAVSPDKQLVLLKQKEAKNSLQRIAAATQETITGTVTDRQSGETLPGVNILVKGTTTGASTDQNGNFQLTVPSLQDTLVVSFIGYQTQEVPIEGRTEIDVVLNSQAIAGEELVVVGYGTQRKENLTGSVAQVSSESLENRGIESVADALQGTVGNLNISTTGRGGEPGATKSINIRGMGTLTGGGGEPYVLVDGIPMGINEVDPDNIESISILKDAAASAIYGSRAPYGVILIQTKRGRGELAVEYSGNYSMQRPAHLASFVSSTTAAKSLNFAASNSGVPGIPQEQMERIKKYANGEIENETVPIRGNPSQWARTFAQGAHANWNWPEIAYGNWAPRQKQNLSFSGATEGIHYYLSGSYFDEGDILRWGDQQYKKINFTANLDTDVTQWLTLSMNSKYIRDREKRPVMSKDSERFHYYGFMYLMGPERPWHTPDGDLISDPFGEIAFGGRQYTTEDIFRVKVAGELEPIEGWKTNIKYNWNTTSLRHTKHKKTVYKNRVGGDQIISRYANPSFTEEYGKSNSYLLTIRSSYEASLGRHNFLGLLGYEENFSENYGSSIEKYGVITPQVPSISTATGTPFVGGNGGHWATQGIFSRITYNFNEKYLFEFNARYDGSSRFRGGNKQWGFFPSGSVGYNISKEPFWYPIEDAISMNNFKLRVSYGSLGNQDISQYLYLPIIPVNTNLHWIMGDSRPNYSSSPDLISEGLTWETANTFNVGLDTGFFENKLAVTFDWYRRKTVNMFGPSEDLPAVLGTSPTLRNNAELKTVGIELGISWEDQVTNNFSYGIGINLGDNKSTVTKYLNPDNYIHGWYAGKTVGTIWGYESEGFFQSDAEVVDHADQTAIYDRWQAGDMKYKDLNGDGKIYWGDRTLDNHGDLKIIGNDLPRYQFGIDATMNYRNFDFRMFWQGVGKRDYYMPDNGKTYFWAFKGQAASTTFYEEGMNFWSPEGAEVGGGPDAYFPRPYLTGEHHKNIEPQTKYLLDASYIRLKNIRLGYTLSQELTRKVSIKNARIYVSGHNILTFSELLKFGLDPESLNAAMYGGIGTYTYPILKHYSIGLNLSF